jgi:hypothetical protein
VITLKKMYINVSASPTYVVCIFTSVTVPFRDWSVCNSVCVCVCVCVRACVLVLRLYVDGNLDIDTAILLFNHPSRPFLLMPLPL